MAGNICELMANTSVELTDLVAVYHRGRRNIRVRLERHVHPARLSRQQDWRRKVAVL